MTEPIQPLQRVRAAMSSMPWLMAQKDMDALFEIVNEKSLEMAMGKTEIHGPEDAYMYRAQYTVKNGVAIVPLIGAIFPRANLFTRMSGATSVDVFSEKLALAIENEKVNAVFLQIDSQGGNVIGVFEAATQVFNLQKQSKPVIALAEGIAASAAYLIGSQADQFYATEMAVVGSIGVVARIDQTHRADLNAGIDTRWFKSGPLKAIGNGPLTDEQSKKMQAMVDDYFTAFKSSVARARPLLNMDEVSTGEVWIGDQAVKNGLVDGIATMDSLLERFGN